MLEYSSHFDSSYDVGGRLTGVLEAVVLSVVGDPFAVGGLGPSVGTDAERESGDDSGELHSGDTTSG